MARPKGSKDLTPEQVARIRELRSEGLTYRQIQARTGIPWTTVATRLQKVAATISIPRNDEAPAADTPKRAIRVTAEELDILRSAGSDVVADLQRDSLRKRTLRAVAVDGPFEDLMLLAQAMRQTDDRWSIQDVATVLNSLNKQGLVKFRTGRSKGEHGGGTADRSLFQIKCTDRGYTEAGFPPRSKELEVGVTGRHAAGWSRNRHAVGKDYTEERYHLPWAKGGPIQRDYAADRPAGPEGPVLDPQQPVAPAVAPLVLGPELVRIFAKQEAIGRVARQAEALMAAAMMLEAVDAEEADHLMTRAAALQPEPLSPLEQEYLDFVKAITGGGA